MHRYLYLMYIVIYMCACVHAYITMYMRIGISVYIVCLHTIGETMQVAHSCVGVLGVFIIFVCICDVCST